MKKPGPFRILEEKLVKRQEFDRDGQPLRGATAARDASGAVIDESADLPDGDDAENPYWSWEELPPHPSPELGCIRRGLCCKSSPGWFAPGEAELAAEALGMEPDAFVRKYLVVDYVDLPKVAEPAVDANTDSAREPETERVFAFAPVKLGIDGRPAIPPATRTDALYQTLRGQCVFFRGDIGDGGAGCLIYKARPTECRLYVCTNAPEDNPTHAQMGQLWRDAASKKT